MSWAAQQMNLTTTLFQNDLDETSQSPGPDLVVFGEADSPRKPKKALEARSPLFEGSSLGDYQESHGHSS